MSRESILAAIKNNQPEQQALPDLNAFRRTGPGDPAAFRKVVETLGGQVFGISSYTEIQPLMAEHLPDARKIVAIQEQYWPGALTEWEAGDGRQFEDVDLAIIPGQFGVAENGAIWITDIEIKERVLPFITQHLAIVVSSQDILPTMHDAYEERIARPEGGFGVFIAGPSKTADIEQSLVLGAHGAKSLTVFLYTPKS
ncbi:LUD domain-containing protein [Chitinophaga sp. CF418]|uniref:LutC/YkgG family protein n=1 Tax=Chitinophaga sp. CF418 TaxID=1855287 RepID=UPI00090F1761|nr:LUD domain-containing protein [Chitinophaga sp. CF418]SHN28985.1 L-lactate dehydrogenase complex protein LldG [Chitinophaga sp. CF418]